MAILRFLTAVGLVFFLPAAGLGQSTFATITGAATDPSGAVTPGVTIEAREINTGYVYRAVTNDSGLYTIGNIREGVFNLKAMKEGFSEFTVDRIVLTALDSDSRMAGHYRLEAVRAHLFEMAGDREAAIACYRAAAGRTASIPERNYLMTKIAKLTADGK